MGFELRPYQKEAVDAGLKFLTGRSKKPGIIVAPCGCGKSLLISKIAHEINRPTLVLQPQKRFWSRIMQRLYHSVLNLPYILLHVV